ncbi:MAG: 23S rRNA (adenine(2503)-C(2))-methyltransferase RlmN [bacterium]|nr:23S rRNA (adenine(2503)-C(2))-methyltransferase RlmN [Myxococcales bacterium]
MSIRPVIPARNLTEMDREQIAAVVADLGEPRYRAAQLHDWVFKRGARSFDEMTNLPKAMRQKLVDGGYAVGRVTLGRVAESVDGTRKLGIRLDDGAVVETVLIPMGEGRFSQCLSSQVGCALDCKFCYTGTLGLSRHLTPGEIVDQVLVARRAVPEDVRITHLVYMGMGEPLHNFDAVVASIKRLIDPDGIGFSARKITVSTSGLVPKIAALGEAVPVNLAISLNASNDAVRDRIMPINKRYPIETLVDAVDAYPIHSRGKMTLEYVLLGGVNDAAENARELTRALARVKHKVRVNLIPWNPFAGPGFDRPEDERVRGFQAILERAGYTVTVRTTKGLDIDAACGQLGERPQAANG